MLLSKLSKIGKKDQSTEWPKNAKKFEQRVDETLRVAGDASKAIGQHVISNKRKKSAEQQLTSALKDSVDKASNDDNLFAYVIRQSADVMDNLSNLRRDFECHVEKQVVHPLARLVEDTRTDLDKEKRAFKKAVSDTREARDQCDRATAQLNQLTGTHSHQNIGGAVNLNGSFSASDTLSNGSGPSEAIAAATARCTQAQNTLDDKERDLMYSKDKLLNRLYTFVGQETNHVGLLLDFFRLQETYLEKSLKLVRNALPELEATIERHKPLTVFHRHLPDHLDETNRSLSYVLETCITKLDNDAAIFEEGLFRKSGSQKKTELLVKALNLMEADDALLDSCDAMTIASALKQYLNSLPEPLMTFALADKWAEAVKECSSGSLDLIETAVREMRPEFRRNMAYLCLFLHKVASFSQMNKMTPENLSIVLTPNLYRLSSMDSTSSTSNTVTGSCDLGRSLDFLQRSGPGIRLVHLMIEHAETLFAEEKIFFSRLLKENSSCANTLTHSRSPSNVSLTELRPPKPAAPARLRSGSADESARLVLDPMHLLPPVVGTSAVDYMSVPDLSSDTEHSESKPSAPAQGSPSMPTKTTPSTMIRIPRKKTIAPKPPILPQSVFVPLHSTSSAEPRTPESSGTPQERSIHSSGDQASLPIIGPSMNSIYSEDNRSRCLNQTDEVLQLKAPPKRPPRPSPSIHK